MEDKTTVWINKKKHPKRGKINDWEKAQIKIKNTLHSEYIWAVSATVRFRVLSSHLLQKYSDIKIHAKNLTLVSCGCETCSLKTKGLH